MPNLTFRDHDKNVDIFRIDGWKGKGLGVDGC